MYLSLPPPSLPPSLPPSSSLPPSISSNRTVSSSDNGLLVIITDILHGQVEACASVTDPVIQQLWINNNISETKREELLGEHLSFINVLLSSAGDVMIRVLSSVKWFDLLLKIVNIQDNNGKV